MQISPYLFFDGQCEAAFDFYAKCFGGTVVGSKKYGSAPGSENMPSDIQNRIMHAALKIGDLLIMASDCPPDRHEKPQGLRVSIDYDDPSQAQQVFTQLSQDGSIAMPMAETFWANCFGMVTDRFGTPWMIGSSKKQQPA